MVINKCPVCDGRWFFPLCYLKGQATGKRFKLYLCFNCHSLFNPSGFKEKEEDLKNDTKWHIDHFQDTSERAFILLSKLKQLQPHSNSFLDIGSGIGATVLQAKSFGMDADGVEPNKYAVKHARDQFSIELKCDFFKKGLYNKNFDIIICTHVLEHVEHPRILFKEAIATLNRPGLFFLSVPWMKKVRHQTKSILLPNLKGYPFSNNDTHIIHFSHRSIRMWAAEFGAKSCEWNKADSTGWYGYIFSFID
ncbi:class I SAM-dependent methyltransferase [Thermodesulfobacteriota bacterium]